MIRWAYLEGRLDQPKLDSCSISQPLNFTSIFIILFWGFLLKPSTIVEWNKSNSEGGAVRYGNVDEIYYYISNIEQAHRHKAC